MEAKGIKNITEILAAVEACLLLTKEVMKDGKIDYSDVVVLPKLVAQLGVIVAAIEDAKEAIEEAKDIQAEEAVALVAKVYAIAKKVQEA